MDIVVWTVTMRTPKGIGAIDVPSCLGKEVAKRRGIMGACSLGWGDIDEIEVIEAIEAVHA